MDLTVAPEDVCKILKDVRDMIKDHLLPRIGQLELEVQALRLVTWPVCQSLREQSQLDDLVNKKMFLKMLESSEIRKLLIEKANVSRNPLRYSTSEMLEYYTLFATMSLTKS